MLTLVVSLDPWNARWSIAGPASAPVIEVGRFSTASPGEALPDGWEPLTFKKIERATRYRLVEDPGDGTVVVQAMSESAASGLIREIRIDPAQFPILRWRWKIAKLIEKGDVTRKDGDDYAARVYVTFEYDASRVGLFERLKYEGVRLLYGQYPPLGALSYIWDTRRSVGTVVPNPYTDRVMMFVVDSGPTGVGTWVRHERNVYEDYKRAFGVEPSMISGVALMTDTDDTRETATAWFGDIELAPAP